MGGCVWHWDSNPGDLCVLRKRSAIKPLFQHQSCAFKHPPFYFLGCHKHFIQLILHRTWNTNACNFPQFFLFIFLISLKERIPTLKEGDRAGKGSEKSVGVSFTRCTRYLLKFDSQNTAVVECISCPLRTSSPPCTSSGEGNSTRSFLFISHPRHWEKRIFSHGKREVFYSASGVRRRPVGALSTGLQNDG